MYTYGLGLIGDQEEKDIKRIANVEHGGKIDMYAKEYQEFKGALFLNTPPYGKSMWGYLDRLLKVDNVLV